MNWRAAVKQWLGPAIRASRKTSVLTPEDRAALLAARAAHDAAIRRADAAIARSVLEDYRATDRLLRRYKSAKE